MKNRERKKACLSHSSTLTGRWSQGTAVHNSLTPRAYALGNMFGEKVRSESALENSQILWNESCRVPAVQNRTVRKLTGHRNRLWHRSFLEPCTSADGTGPLTYATVRVTKSLISFVRSGRKVGYAKDYTEEGVYMQNVLRRRLWKLYSWSAYLEARYQEALKNIMNWMVLRRVNTDNLLSH